MKHAALKLLTVALLGGSACAALAQTALVELANFACPRCRAVNDQFDRVIAAATEAGLPLRFAPLAWEGQSAWPDRVYYATRDLFPAAERLVRDALFDGMQREGQRFEELAQVVSYFERRQLPAAAMKLDPRFNLAALLDHATSDAPLLSEIKAARLAQLSGAEEVPVFVWVKDGEIVSVVSPKNAAEPGPLLQLVLQQTRRKEIKP